jgi:membrane protein YdbS with pleckstrin-like domain
VSYSEKTLAPGEKIVYRARYHWIVYRNGLLILLLGFLLAAAALYASNTSPATGLAAAVGYLAGGLALLGGMVLAARAFRASRDEFVVTDRRVLRAVGVLGREHEQSLISKIQDITVSQGLLGRLLGYGDVVLETASERGTLVFPSVANPEAFRTAIWSRPEASTGTAGAGMAPATPQPSGASARLEELDSLRKRGMVSDEEYAAKRREILSAL